MMHMIRHSVNDRSVNWLKNPPRAYFYASSESYHNIICLLFRINLQVELFGPLQMFKSYNEWVLHKKLTDISNLACEIESNSIVIHLL